MAESFYGRTPFVTGTRTFLVLTVVIKLFVVLNRSSRTRKVATNRNLSVLLLVIRTFLRHISKYVDVPQRRPSFCCH
ncbi:hypothetical protein NPIL_131071 [Nephila pilipes]|uniref:Uncharacterized protein n=1 Tax=Nephila pilipes TaxID=299642 RepID=A0A8X6PRV8_NEPPI|nr:hypothetical protein NPIL_131071 [Nephila pilipes]